MAGQKVSVKQVFISYATEDTDFAHRLADDLKRLGARVWIAPESIPPGESWVDGIERGLRESSHVVMVLTPAALEASGAKMERDMAIALALQDRIKVISLRVKPCEVPLVLSRYQMILAFQEDYEAGLKELAGHLGLRAVPLEAEGIETPQPTRRRLADLPLLALAALLVLVIGVVALGVFVSGLIGGREEPAPGPIASVPEVTHTLAPPTGTPVPASSIPPSDASLHDTWTRPADGMEMVYVPGGTFQMGSTDAEIDAVFERCEQNRGSDECQRGWFENESPVHSVTLDGFWIDKTEVTNAQFERFVQATDYRTDAEKRGTGWEYRGGSWGDVDGADWQHPSGPETGISGRMDHPVVQVSWTDARTYCGWVGGRLPTEAEWEYGARGPDGHIYPWGNDPPDDTLLNYNYTVFGTTEVGSYLYPNNSASWVGALDMAGNVSEWVNDWSDSDYYASSPSLNPKGPETGTWKVLRGGGWPDNEERVRAAYRHNLRPDIRSSYLGFRCVVAPTSSSTPAAAVVTSTATAASVSPTDTPVLPIDTPTPDPSIPPSGASLHDTWTRPADDMEMVYVPGGTFEMGSIDGDVDEQPVHAVTLDSFWIDRTEVTNAQYARCVADGRCSPPSETGSFTRGSYYGDSQFDEYSVIYVSWHDADTYCQWAGGRLPTEAVWEYAARGRDGHIYPWGSASPDDTLLNYNKNVGDTTRVGSYPGGASWVGATDMAGNVHELVADWKGEYSSEAQTDPKGSATGTSKVVRGGSWDGDKRDVRAARRSEVDPVVRFYDIGFRCVVKLGN